MNKKYILGAMGLLAVGAVSSVAVQSFAQTPSSPVIPSNAPAAVVSTTAAAKADTDIETNDDATSLTGQSSTVNEANDKETADDGATAQSSAQTSIGDGDGENAND